MKEIRSFLNAQNFLKTFFSKMPYYEHYFGAIN